MTRQLKQRGQFKDGKFCYNADGVVWLQDFHNIKICVAEVFGVFKNTDITKLNFDHHKGMLVGLSMLKIVADELMYALVGVFQKVNVFFVHAAGKLIVLCVNPDRIGHQHAYAIRSRDTNAAVNIMKTGLYKLITNDNHPSFSRNMKKEDALKKLFHGLTQFGKLMSNFLSV